MSRPDHVESVLRACEILQAFPDSGDLVRVQDLAAATGLHKATVSRLLLTLEAAGFVERAGRHGYRSHVRLATRRKLRIGYSSQSETSIFAHEVTSSLEQRAKQQGVDILTFDNRYDPDTTRRNVERMVAEHVDVAIEFQTFEEIAHAISCLFQQARIPMISVDLPVPGATYFGANNYQAGRIAGRALARWTQKHWHGEFDEVLLIELAAGGASLASRMNGALAGVMEVLRGVQNSQVVRLDGANTFEGACRSVKRHIQKSRTRRRIVLTMNDPNALGALEAFRELSAEDRCAVAGQGATHDARQELRKSTTRLIGTVAYFPERYGDSLVKLAFDLLHRRVVPPAVYTRHKWIHPGNVDRIYPHDHSKPRRTHFG